MKSRGVSDDGYFKIEMSQNKKWLFNNDLLYLWFLIPRIFKKIRLKSVPIILFMLLIVLSLTITQLLLRTI